jgi:hypothetical protein
MIMILFHRHRCIISSSTDSSRSSSNSFAACLPVYLFSLPPVFEDIKKEKKGQAKKRFVAAAVILECENNRGQYADSDRVARLRQCVTSLWSAFFYLSLHTRSLTCTLPIHSILLYCFDRVAPLTNTKAAVVKSMNMCATSPKKTSSQRIEASH